VATLKEQIKQIEDSTQADIVLVRALTRAYNVLTLNILEALRRCGDCHKDRFCPECVVVYRRLRELNESVTAALRGEGGEP